jgi:hypothetical protein
MSSRQMFPLLAWLGVLLSPLTGAAADRSADERIVVPLRSISIFDEGEPEAMLYSGQTVRSDTQPAAEVKNYPRLKSTRALYGQAEFDRQYFDNKQGIRFAFVIDESDGTGSGYDRLYFDFNQDLDLTNDPVLEPMKDPPALGRYTSTSPRPTVFDYLPVGFDCGPPIGKRQFKLLPSLVAYDRDRGYLRFIMSEARKGEVRIGEQQFQVLLSQPYYISGRFDRPYTKMTLKPVNGKDRFLRWYGGDQLGAFYPIDGQLYQFSTTPLGDSFTAEPYRGDLGVFRAGAGGRKLDQPQMSGSLVSQTHTLAVGKTPAAELFGRPDPITEVMVPVGDYAPASFRVHMGKMIVALSRNYHSDGKPRDRDRASVYGIKIRKDKPFVLDFSNKPEVLFATPSRDQVLHPGEEIRLEAALIDPVLDIMVRDLIDPTRSTKEQVELSDGTKTTLYTREYSLDPIVIITDAAGKRVAEGTMPFG